MRRVVAHVLLVMTACAPGGGVRLPVDPLPSLRAAGGAGEPEGVGAEALEPAEPPVAEPPPAARRPLAWTLQARTLDVAGVWGSDVRKHASAVTAVRFASATHVVSASRDGAVLAWSDDRSAPAAAPGRVAEGVASLAVSPDGAWAAVVTADRRVVVLRGGDPAGATGAAPAPFEPHRGGTHACAFVGGGAPILATAGEDGAVRAWEPATLRRLRTLTPPGPAGPLTALAASLDGALLAAGGADAAIRVWTTSDGALAAQLGGHLDRVSALAFSPDGRLLASGAWDGSVRVWEVAAGRELHRLTGHVARVNAVAWTPDGASVVSAAGDGRVIAWDATTGQPRRTFAGHVGRVLAVAVSPDGGRVASGGEDGAVRLWDLATGAELEPLGGREGRVNAVAVSADGRLALRAADRGVLELWDVAGDALVRAFAGHTADVTGAALSPDGARAASTSRDRTVRLWDVASGAPLQLARNWRWTNAVAFTPDGTKIFYGSSRWTPQLLDAATAKDVMRFGEHGNRVNAVAVSSDGTLGATASSDHTAKIWELATGKAVAALKGHTARVTSVAFSPDGRVVVTGAGDRTVRGWDATTGAELWQLALDAAPVAVAFSRDGRAIVAALADGKLHLRHAETREPIDLVDLAAAADRPTSVAPTPDGGLLVGTARGLVLRLVPKSPE